MPDFTFDIDAVLQAVDRAEHAITADLVDAAVERAQADAPSVTGRYKNSIHAEDGALAADADYSIMVELRHNTLHNAVEALQGEFDRIAERHT